ncbi:MAG TPA: zinc-binding dehydrogenase [Actinomycetes bacterium]|nr:zinc-binding dehydrogenase [Actinomycetes bacterium]
MKALLTTGEGGPGLKLGEVPEPTAASNEALVAVTATSLNRGEVRHLREEEQGVVLGWDVVGTVSQRARDGSGPDVGTRVVGLVDEGAWAEQVAIPTHALAQIPDGVTDAAASVLPIAGLTAWRALELGGPLLGSRVLITGASGGVGRLAVQLAARAGAHVTAVVGRPERAHGLAELGAEDVVVGIESAQGPFDVVLESVGGQSMRTASHELAPEGVLVSYGRSSGEDASLDPYWFGSHSGARIEGLLVFTEVARHRLGTPQLDRLLALMDAGKLDPQVSRVGSWTDPMPLVQALLDREVEGKAVLLVD